MTNREAKRLAYKLVSTELRITLGCGTIYNDPEYPADPADGDRVDRAIEEIIMSLAAKGV